MKSKVTEEISNIFKLLFDSSNVDRVDTEMLEAAFQTLKTILTAINSNDKSFTSKNPAKLMFEEKGIFEFIEKLGCTFKNNTILLKNIINSFMTYSSKDSHQEAYARRSIICLYNLIVQGFVNDEEVL